MVTLYGLRDTLGLPSFPTRRSSALAATAAQLAAWALQATSCWLLLVALGLDHRTGFAAAAAVLFAGNITARSEEHTSELQSHVNLVCRLLLGKKKQLCPARRASQYD